MGLSRVREACSHWLKRSGVLLLISYFEPSLIDLSYIDISNMFFFSLPSILECKSLHIAQGPSPPSVGLHPDSNEGLRKLKTDMLSH